MEIAVIIHRIMPEPARARAIEISFLEKSDEVKKLEEARNYLVKQLEETKEEYLKKSEEMEKLNFDTSIKNSLNLTP